MNRDAEGLRRRPSSSSAAVPAPLIEKQRETLAASTQDAGINSHCFQKFKYSLHSCCCAGEKRRGGKYFQCRLVRRTAPAETNESKPSTVADQLLWSKKAVPCAATC